MRISIALATGLLLAAAPPLAAALPTCPESFTEIAVAASSNASIGTHIVVELVKKYAWYTSIGDSYSSGVGAQSKLPSCTDGQKTDCSIPGCADNTGSFAYRFNQQYAPGAFRFLACQGKDTVDIKNTQVDSVSSPYGHFGSPDLVTITAGANNGDTLYDLVHWCIQAPTTEHCNNALSRATTAIAVVQPHLENLYNDVKTRSPRDGVAPTVVILGYVHIFSIDAPASACNTGNLDTISWASAGAGGIRDKVNQRIAGLNDKIKAAAAATGVVYADVNGLFGGHRLCDPAPWFQTSYIAAGGPNSQVGHPTIDGHTAYLSALVSALGG